MSLVYVLVVLIVVGLLVYAVNNWLAIDEKFKIIINVVVVLVAILWLLGVFVPGVLNLRVGPR